MFIVTTIDHTEGYDGVTTTTHKTFNEAYNTRKGRVEAFCNRYNPVTFSRRKDFKGSVITVSSGGNVWLKSSIHFDSEG